MLLSLAFFFAIIVIGLRKKESPIILALSNMVMIFSLFVATGITSNIFAYVLIFACSGIITKIVNDMFLGQFGETKIMISYIVFLGLSLFFVNFANFTSTIFSGNVPAVGNIVCSSGLIIIDGLLGCGITYLQRWTALLFLSSSVGIVNTALFVPFLYLLSKYVLDWFRGRGGN